MVAYFVRMPHVAAIIGCALIAGCGGGGGGGSGPPQNRTPTFGTVQFSAIEDTDLSAQVTATDADGDALTFTRTGDPGKGTVSAFGANGSFTYRPNRDVFGSDSFTVRVADSLGNALNGTVTIQIAGVADPPTARNDMLTVTQVGLASLDVRGNDLDPDGEILTVTIESPAEVGTASVNANGTVAISGLPAGFRGVTRFKYRVTDQSNAFSVATAAAFVDITPFRVVFGGDEPGDGSYEMYITDLISAPLKLTAATQGSLRLRSFSAAANGSTVAYRRHDINNADAPADFFFVRTADPATQVPIQLPPGMTLHPNDSRNDTYMVSPDGQWIAGIASRSPAGIAVILINVANPAVVHTGAIGASFVQQLQFSRDSQYLYFLASLPGDTGLFVYRVAMSLPNQSELVSAPPSGVVTDSVAFYSVLADNSKVLLQASRNDVTNVYMVDTSNRGTEMRLNHALAPGDQLIASNVGGTFMFATPDVTRIGYYVEPAVGQVQSYVVEISATPNPRPFGPAGLRFAMMRPDNQAALFESPTQVLEALVDSAQAPTPLCDDCFNARYDSRGDAVMAQVDNLPSPTNPEEYLSVAAAVRPTFGTQRHVGTPDMAAHFANFSGGDRAVVLIGEGQKILFPPPPTFHMALVNVWAPDKLIYLADFDSPIGLRSGRALVVEP